jgi:hypothetical protein
MDLSIDSRVWVYQSDRSFSDSEVETINVMCSDFIKGWAAHGSPLKASFEVIDKFFLVLAVDQNVALASGCSIDSSVKFIKELEIKVKINFFNRMNLVVKNDEETKLIPFSELRNYSGWKVYNPLVNDLKTLHSSFLIPVTESEFYKIQA